MMEAKKKNNICAILYKTKERSEFFYFSNPFVLTPSYHLYVSKSGKQTIDRLFGRDVKRERLEELLKRAGDLRIAITPKQSYGFARDKILSRYKDKVDFTYNYTHQSALVNC